MLRGIWAVLKILSAEEQSVFGLLPTHSAPSIRPRRHSVTHSTPVPLACGNLQVNLLRAKCLVVSG